MRLRYLFPNGSTFVRLFARGPLAHLVERFHGMEEVTGSSPVGSTSPSKTD